jgi:Transglutaminase-like superfamily
VSMRVYERALLMARVFLELLAYDLVMKIRGFSGANRWMRRRRCGRAARAREQVEAAVVRAVSSASSFYWKPVRCLQRSVVTARVLSHYGVSADVVIGYRPAPFFSHAWVEVKGRVANDLPGYRRQLLILERF